uniref:Nardilysin-like n=2 Tax=Cicer arietinum TaxID=3827 RepID=A0A3Q7Y342_CICAR|nr:nardilysin-like [Cicer arietinum]
MDFIFGDGKSQLDYAAKLSENLLLYSREHVIYADYAYKRWNKQLIRQLLRFFVPENMRVDMVSNVFQMRAPKFESWFGIYYSVEDIDRSLMKLWRNSPSIDYSLYLPSKNEFIPTISSVHLEDIYDDDCQHSTSPSCITDDATMKIWYKRDTTYKVPFSSTYFRINFKEACDSVENCALSELFIHLLKDQLCGVIYQGRIAKFDISISFVDGMLELKLSGFNDKLPLLLSKVLLEVNSFMPTDDRYELMREDLKRNLMNHDNVDLEILLCEHSYHSNEKQLYLSDDLLLDDMKKFIRDLRSQVYIEGLCHGNLTKKEAIDIGEMIKKRFSRNPLPVKSRHAERVICLPLDANLVLDLYASKTIFVAECYFQIEQDIGLVSTKLMALFELFGTIVEEPFFNQLRTTDHVGYDVSYSTLKLNHVFGFCLQVKSSKYNPNYMQSRIDSFIDGLEVFFDNLDDESTIKIMHRKSCCRKVPRLWKKAIDCGLQ